MLTKHDLDEVLQHYPQIKTKILDTAEERQRMVRERAAAFAKKKAEEDAAKKKAEEDAKRREEEGLVSAPDCGSTLLGEVVYGNTLGSRSQHMPDIGHHRLHHLHHHHHHYNYRHHHHHYYHLHHRHHHHYNHLHHHHYHHHHHYNHLNHHHHHYCDLKTYGERAFSVAAPRLWNALPLNIRNCKTITTFKFVLKTHLFKSYFEPWKVFIQLVYYYCYFIIIIFYIIYYYFYHDTNVQHYWIL